MSGLVQTVLVPVRPEELGPTLPHEHLLLDFSFIFKPPAGASERHRAYLPVTIENLGWVCYEPFRSYDNLVTIDEDVAVRGAALAERFGIPVAGDPRSVPIKHRLHCGVLNPAVAAIDPDGIMCVGVRHKGRGLPQDFSPFSGAQRVIAVGSEVAKSKGRCRARVL